MSVCKAKGFYVDFTCEFFSATESLLFLQQHLSREVHFVCEASVQNRAGLPHLCKALKIMQGLHIPFVPKQVLNLSRWSWIILLPMKSKKTTTTKHYESKKVNVAAISYRLVLTLYRAKANCILLWGLDELPDSRAKALCHILLFFTFYILHDYLFMLMLIFTIKNDSSP